MINLVNGKTADEVWIKAAQMLRESPTKIDQTSRAGQTRELLHTCLSIKDPRERWVTSREPALNPAFALAEVVWIMNGRRDSRFMNFWYSRLPEFAGEGPEYHGAYGWRLRKHLGLDQLERAYHTLRNNPDSRQVVLQIWDSAIDMPSGDGKPVSKDVPCNLLSMLKVRDGKLEWAQVMRSNDIFRGLPYNIVQFTSLQEVMAGWLGLDLGSYVHMSDSLHVYEQNVDSIMCGGNGPEVPNEDTISFGKELSESCWGELARRTEMLIDERTTESHHQKLSEWSDVPVSFRNILVVLCAEAARRRKWIDGIDSAMKLCTNGVYKLLWQRWVDRLKKSRFEQDDSRCA